MIVWELKRVEVVGKFVGLVKLDGDEDGSVLIGRLVVWWGESLG